MNKAIEALDRLKAMYFAGDSAQAENDYQIIRAHLNTWRPISEAPRDGTVINSVFLGGANYNKPKYAAVKWDRSRGWVLDAYCSMKKNPILWQPITPPEGSE